MAGTRQNLLLKVKNYGIPQNYFINFCHFFLLSLFFLLKKSGIHQILTTGSGIQGPIIGPYWTLCPRLKRHLTVLKKILQNLSQQETLESREKDDGVPKSKLMLLKNMH